MTSDLISFDKFNHYSNEGLSKLLIKAIFEDPKLKNEILLELEIRGENIEYIMGKDRQIKYIMEGFDFERVHKAMTHLNWTWRNTSIPQSVPTIEELKNTAFRFLNEVWNESEDGSPVICHGAGGFMACRDIYDGHKIISLRFELSSYGFDIEDIKVINYDGEY